jgi:hypothetical protein
MYQVIIKLDFENEPTDEDVHDACRAWADNMRSDYELRIPDEDPFDVPIRHLTIYRY